MNDLQCTIHSVRCTILKYSVLTLSFICFFSSKAQEVPTGFNYIDSAEIQRRMAFQDSIFNGLIKPKPYESIKSKKTIPFNTTISVDTTKNLKAVEKTSIGISKKTNDSTLSNTILIENVEKGKNKKQKKIDTTHYSPKKAAIWAAACPGLGQIYMKKYWKLPIVYGVLSATLYFVASNGKKLKTYNGYIRNIYDTIPNPSPIDQLSLGQVESFRDTYRRNVQLASFGTLFAWGLSIVDAVVDAHLHSFDISDKLSMKIKPDINYSNFTYYTGIGVHLNFK